MRTHDESRFCRALRYLHSHYDRDSTGERAEQLSGAVKDSPMTDKKTEYSGMAGATYNF